MKHLKLYENIFDELDAEELEREQKLKELKKDQILKLQNHIKYLQTTGDDSSVKRDIQNIRHKIRNLKNDIMSDKQKFKHKKNKEKAETRSHDKKITQYEIQSKIEKRFQNQLTDRQKAINTLVDLTYSKRNYTGFKNIPQRVKLKLQKEIDDLKSKYDIKSYELKKSKLLSLETDVLLNIHTLEDAIESYSTILNNLQTTNNNRQRNLYRKQLNDIIKFYGNKPFKFLYDY